MSGDGGRRVTITIPAGAVLKVMSEDEDRMVHVICQGHQIVMFATDIMECGEVIKECGGNKTKSSIIA